MGAFLGCQLVFQVLGVLVVLVLPFLCDLIHISSLIFEGLNCGIGIRELLFHSGKLRLFCSELILGNVTTVRQVYDFQVFIAFDLFLQLFIGQCLRLSVYSSKKFLQKFVHGVPP